MENEKEVGDFITDMLQTQQALSGRTDKMETDLKDQQTTVTRLVKEYRIIQKDHSESIETTKNEQEQLRQQVNTFTDDWEAKFDKSLANMDEVIDRGNEMFNKFPRELQLENKYRFEGRTKIAVIVIACSLIVSSISLGLWSWTYMENKRLKENDWKYRFLQITLPSATLYADTSHNQNSKRFQQFIEQQEAKKQSVQAAEAIVREREQETKDAKKEVEKLRRQKSEKSVK